MTNNKVFLTGYGAITSAGATADETWQSIKQARTGIARITHWDASDWEYSQGGEIKDYDPKRLCPDRKLLKLLSRQDVIGLCAAIQAVEQSGLISARESLSDPEVFNEKTGIFVGSPGNKFYQQYDYLPLLSKTGNDLKAFAQGLEEYVHPMWLLRVLPNNVLAYTGIRYGFKGLNQNITNHAVSGTQAIMEAYHAIRSGQVERAVVIAYDYALGAQELMYYQAIGLLSKTSVRSFDASRDGTIMGEGAGALILESSDSAQKRGANLYAEILSGSTFSEGASILSQDAGGVGLVKAISDTLNKANISPGEIGMIVAHANGTRTSDESEAAAIHACFKGYQVPVTGFKWATGHTLTAAGVIESILMLLALREKKAPGIPTLTEKDWACERVQASSSEQPTQSSIGLLVSRAFYSLNSCLLIKAL